MSCARRIEGPCAPLFYLAAALLLLSVHIANAQTVDRSALEMCTNLETPELKLACFEAIIATGRAPGEQVPDSGSAAAVSETAATSAPETAPASVKGEPGIAPDVAASQVATKVSPVVSAPPPEEDFGREQLAAPDPVEKDKVITATVVDVTQAYNKTLIFHLANGHIWRQIEPRRLQYPKDGDFEVRISQGVMGEYRLRIGDNGRMVRIRRIQ